MDDLDEPEWKATLHVFAPCISKRLFNSKKKVTVTGFSRYRAESAVNELFDKRSTKMDYRILSIERVSI
jgi:hypothetical protein